MAKVYLEDSTLTAIGSAIRDKAGTSGLLLPSEMPSAISAIETGGGGDSEIIYKYALITPTSTATVVDLSPWITEANINDWFLYANMAYWGYSDVVNSMCGIQAYGPMFRNFFDETWQTVTIHGEGGAPMSATNSNGKIFVQNATGWKSRYPTWNATAKTLTFSNTKFISSQQIALIYREV